MHKQLINTVQNFVSLNETELAALCNSFELRTVPAQTILLEGGDISDEVYFINKASIHGTTSAFSENQFAGVFDSLIQHAPSSQTLRTVEDSELLVLSSEKLMRLYSEILKIPVLFGKIAEGYLKSHLPFD